MIETLPNTSSTDLSDLRKVEVTKLLKRVIVPILNNDIVSLGMVRNLRIVDDYV
ncbi:MAG: iron-sulfur cluster assembly protein, partial [Pseudanabaena sp.]